MFSQDINDPNLSNDILNKVHYDEMKITDNDSIQIKLTIKRK